MEQPDKLTPEERAHVEDVRAILELYTFGARLDVLLQIVDRVAPKPALAADTHRNQERVG